MRYIGLFLASLIVIVTVAFFTFYKSEKSMEAAKKKSADIMILPSSSPTLTPYPTRVPVDTESQMNIYVTTIGKILQAEVTPKEFIIERGIDDRLVSETVRGYKKTFSKDNSETASDVLTALYSYFSIKGFNTEQFDDSNSGRFNIHVSFAKAKIRCIMHNTQDAGTQEITIEIGCNQFE